MQNWMEKYERIKTLLLDHVSAMMVLGTIVLLLGGYMAFVSYQRRSMQVDVSIKDETKFTEAQIAAANQKIQPVIPKMPSLYREADRLRIAQALAAIATAMYVQSNVEDVNARRTNTYSGEVILQKLLAAQLLPPGVDFIGNGRCESEHGVYDIRVEPNRQIIEVFAFGKPNGENGDTYLIQLNPSDVEQTVRTWRTKEKMTSVAVGLQPVQFMEAGWTSERLHDIPLEADDKARVQVWVRNGGK